MLGDTLLIKKAYVECSGYRIKAMKTIGGSEPQTPTNIAKKSGIRTNHISKTLHELKKIELVECLNEEQRKGRLYRLTREGEKVYQDMVKND